MSRTVIRLEELLDDDNEVRINFRPEEPHNVSERMRWRILGCNLAGPPFADLAAVAPGDKNPLANGLVRLVGEAIYTALGVHPGVSEALDLAVNGRHPVRLLTSALGAEGIPWEALHHPQARFLGLDRRFALQREIQAGSGDLTRVHTAPLRMTAILAATDRDARGEWEALRDAIEAGGLEAHLTVFVADDALEQAVAADAKAWVTIGRVPPTKEELLTALERARPQVLHVFSHGTAEDGGFLEVSTPGSAFGDPPLYLEARHVADLRDELWLVTLDACEGATPAGGVHSFAYNLVDSGVPAAIGMREVIDQGDANMFCRAFYTRALSRLAQELLPGTTVEVGWAGAAAAAREALCARVPGPAATTAAFQKPWTLPVLYARSGRFLVDTPAPTPGLDADERERLAAELEAFRRALQNLHPDSPPLVRGQLQEQITRLKSALLGR